MDKSGNKPFVFVSYSHKDKEKVVPILNRLISEGVAIWYDKGIEAGSEWPDYIAQKILDCDRMICFISEGYSNSKNCSRELYFAISRNKPVLSIYLEDKVDMAPGMMMNLESYQSLYYSRFKTKDEFCDSLLKENFIEGCKSAPEQADTTLVAEVTPEIPENVTVIRGPSVTAKKGYLERAEVKYLEQLQRVKQTAAANPDNGELVRKQKKIEKAISHIDIVRLKRDNATVGTKIFKCIGVAVLCAILFFMPENLIHSLSLHLPVERAGFGQAAVTATVILGLFCLFDLFIYEYYDPIQRLIGSINYLVTLSLSVLGSLWCCVPITGWIDVTAAPVLFYLVVIVAFVLLNIAMMFVRYFIWMLVEPLLYYA